jgi:putative phage-type endonuclease
MNSATMPSQGTQEWLELRKGKLTASKMPVIMGMSPYQTPLQLWEEELGLRPATQMRPHMEDGLKCEDEARDYFFDKTCVRVKPDVIFSTKTPLFMASLDGISEDGSIILEIKKNNRDYHEMARSGNVVDFHQCQMQAQMYCTGLDVCHYLSYRKGDEIIVIVPRDDVFIEKMVAKGLEFKRMLDDLEPPELMDRDYYDLTEDFELSELAQQYRYHNTLAVTHKQKSDDIKDAIKAIANGRSIRGNGIKMTKYQVKGRIDYDTLVKDLLPDTDFEPFRKLSTTSYRITVE